MAKELLPVYGLRRAEPKVCATCKHGKHDGKGWFECQRPNGPKFDSGDGKFWYATCKLWTKERQAVEVK